MSIDDEIISEKDFVEVWGATSAEGDLLTYEQARLLPDKAVWTVVEAEDDWVALAGYHIVNKLGYVFTEKHWETGLESAMWCEGLGEDEGPDEEE